MSRSTSEASNEGSKAVSHVTWFTNKPSDGELENFILLDMVPSKVAACLTAMRSAKLSPNDKICRPGLSGRSEFEDGKPKSSRAVEVNAATFQSIEFPVLEASVYSSRADTTTKFLSSGIRPGMNLRADFSTHPVPAFVMMTTSPCFAASHRHLFTASSSCLISIRTSVGRSSLSLERRCIVLRNAVGKHVSSQSTTTNTEIFLSDEGEGMFFLF
mmetsp:Transcript_39582/g.67344  ORF Transcript_39582/g.67344 Transcript_39582/m.67344 type:complete len:215 (-) Transcript_39582:160-804(-)